MEHVTTNRLIIRRMAPTDLQDFMAYQTHPENHRHQQIAPKSEAEALAYLERQAVLDLGDEEGWMAFAVEVRGDRRMIGKVGVWLNPMPAKTETDSGVQESARQGDIGWSIHPDYQRRGYATEAAEVLLAYVFDELKLHRVTATCDSPNIASVRVMEKLGMRREAHFVENQFANGAWIDVFAYALLRREWLQGHDRPAAGLFDGS